MVNLQGLDLALVEMPLFGDTRIHQKNLQEKNKQKKQKNCVNSLGTDAACHITLHRH